jgi:molecular chaperone GrpE
VTDGKRHRTSPADEVVFLDDANGQDVARAVEEAVRAVTAVEARHRHAGPGSVFPPPVKRDDGSPGRSELLELPELPEPQEPHEAPASSDDMADEAGRAARLEAELGAERERAVKAQEESQQLREALLRKTADFENVKRRTEKEKNDHFRFALAEAFRDLLGVVDNFERALAHAPEGIRSGDFCVGVEMIARQLSEVLRHYGLTEVPADHLPFDPAVHEAVAREEMADVAPGVVLAVFQKGYFLNDRLLRPAMVKVSALPGKPRPEDAQ